MLRKSLIGAVAVLGIALAGSVASAQPASAGYACGPWNGYCGYFLYPGWGWNWGGYGNNHHHKWDENHGHNNWNGNWHGNGNGNWNKGRPGLQEGQLEQVLGVVGETPLPRVGTPSRPLARSPHARC